MVLFTESIGDEVGKSFAVVHTESDIPGKFGKLEKFDHKDSSNCVLAIAVVFFMILVMTIIFVKFA